jgi:hypothetical protein
LCPTRVQVCASFQSKENVENHTKLFKQQKKSLSQSRISDLLKPSREKKSAIGDFLECTYDRLRIKTMFGS